MIDEKIKALVQKEKEKGNKKNIESLVVFLLILVITIIAINTILNDNPENNKSEDIIDIQTPSTQVSNKVQMEISEDDLERKLENKKTKIEGVGKVSVLITYSQTSEMIAMYNENIKESSTEEEDKTGGTRKITELDNSKEVIYKDSNGEKTPVMQTILLPKVEGAIITAERSKKC